MTAVFHNNKTGELLDLIEVESITVGYKQFKMIHELKIPGRQNNIPPEDLYWIIKAIGLVQPYYPMSEWSLERVEK